MACKCKQMSNICEPDKVAPVAQSAQVWDGPATCYKSIVKAVLAIAVFAGTLFGQAKPGYYSSDAVLLENWKGTAVSPDRMKRVSVKWLDEKQEGFPTSVTIQYGRRSFATRIEFGLNTEILWSPDSTRFAVSGSSGGANGPYQIAVLTLSPQGLRKQSLTQLIYDNYGPVNCGPGFQEAPNLAAIRWLTPHRIVIAAEIVNHSVCDSHGTFKAYEIDLRRMKILKIHNQISAKKKFGSSLGKGLRNAPDECIRKPESCYVQWNHPELSNRKSSKPSKSVKTR